VKKTIDTQLSFSGSGVGAEDAGKCSENNLVMVCKLIILKDWKMSLLFPKLGYSHLATRN
jgi:hypothetical protein